MGNKVNKSFDEGQICDSDSSPSCIPDEVGKANDLKEISNYFIIANPSMIKICERISTFPDKVNMQSFQIIKIIGNGMYGRVMLVKNKNNNELYALKSFRKKDIINYLQVNHIKSEKKILTGLIHPFIVPLKYSFQTKFKLFFVYEFIAGGELFNHLCN